MPTNRLQHFVSRFTIREFLGGSDRLFCLNKETLEVADRTIGNTPDTILREAYYYTTDNDDFDGDIVTPLERSLAPLCQERVCNPDPPPTTSEMALLTDWCALTFARSTYFAHVAPIARDTLSEEERADLPKDEHAMVLVARRATFDRIRTEMRKVGLMFRFLKGPRPHSYYLTDNLAMGIPFRRVGSIGPMLLPLSHELILAVAPTLIAEDFFHTMKPTLEWTTLVQCGWARRLIYSADLESLDFAAWVLSEGSSNTTSIMRSRARQPFFGLAVRSELESLWADEAALDRID